MSASTPRFQKPPDLRLGPLSLWVHGYEREDTDEFYDANWLRVTLHCGAEGSSVEVSGSVLTTDELAHWCADLDRMYSTLSGKADLQPMEPNLSVLLAMGRNGHIAGAVSLTPDHLMQAHEFRFEVDQSHLPAIVAQLRAIAALWPVRMRP